MSETGFIKMHGLGNDFIVLDGRRSLLSLTSAQVHAIANRRTGVGCDQLVIMDAGRDTDVFMRIYNADGSEVGACGNATRCVARLIMDERGVEKVSIATKTGWLNCEKDGTHIAVDMGAPRFGWRDIPLSQEMDTDRLDLQVGPKNTPILQAPMAVSMGNPHCIFFVENPDDYNLSIIGPMIETHPLFPERVNVSLAQVVDRAHIRLRVWERGVGETPACGTAACAVCVAAHRKGHTQRQVVIALEGGTLDINWRDDDHIVMTGPAETSFRGMIDLNAYAVPISARQNDKIASVAS
jgi:diaminopimelate epimerase